MFSRKKQVFTHQAATQATPFGCCCFRSTKINNLFVVSPEMLRMLDSCRTTRTATGIVVASAVRVDVNCAGVELRPT